MVGPWLAEGADIKGEAFLGLFIPDYRLDRGIGYTPTYRSGYWRAGLRYADRCGLWASRRMARYLYQYLAAGDAVVSI